VAYPLIPETWTDPVNQNLYASILIFLAQTASLGIWWLLKWLWKSRKDSVLLSSLGWLGVTVPPLLIFGASLFSGGASQWLQFTLFLSLLPAAIACFKAYATEHKKATRAEAILGRLQAIGVRDAIINPDIDVYREFLSNSNSSFAFLGVGAEKLTRDFNVFQAMVSRCGTSTTPVRLLLVSPDAEWLTAGASRRGLGKSAFLDNQAASLKRIARVRSEFSGQIVVRFYSTRPVLRLMFSNSRACWLGHYTESAAVPGQNEFAEQSNSSVLLQRPEDRAPDQQFYGALEALFQERWDFAGGTEWDFKTYLP
jgi:hypothetical protein